MKEFKGKCEFGFAFIAFGIICVALAAIAVALAYSSQPAVAAVAGIVFGVGGALLFIDGLNLALYSRKIVLKVFDDRVEFLSRGKIFNGEWRSALFGEIKDFRVARNGYYDKLGKKVKTVNKKSGSVWFTAGENGYCWVDVEDCFSAGSCIMEKLAPEQIDSQSELKK